MDLGRIALAGGVDVGAAALLVITNGRRTRDRWRYRVDFMGLSGAAATSAGLADLLLPLADWGWPGALWLSRRPWPYGRGVAAAGMTNRTADLAQFDFVPLGGTGTHVDLNPRLPPWQLRSPTLAGRKSSQELLFNRVSLGASHHPLIATLPRVLGPCAVGS